MNDLLDILTVVGIATKPLWVWVRESPMLRHTKGRRLGSKHAPTEEGSELIDEIRRITSVLEFGRRDMCRDTTSANARMSTVPRPRHDKDIAHS